MAVIFNQEVDGCKVTITSIKTLSDIAIVNIKQNTYYMRVHGKKAADLLMGSVLQSLVEDFKDWIREIEEDKEEIVDGE